MEILPWPDTVGRKLDCLLGEDWPIKLMYITDEGTATSHLRVPVIDADASFPACCSFTFSTPSLIPPPLFHCRCQSCPELSLPSNPNIILNSPSPDCHLFWESRGTRKVKCEVSSPPSFPHLC